MSKKPVAQRGRSGFGERDEQFGGEGGGEVEELAEKNGKCRQPNDTWRIGIEDNWAIDLGTPKPALRHQKKPELVVAGGWEQCEQRNHAGGSKGEDREDMFQCRGVSFVGGHRPCPVRRGFGRKLQTWRSTKGTRDILCA